MTDLAPIPAGSPSLHPANLAVRFLLELAALVAIGRWGFHAGTGALAVVLAAGLPLAAAVAWAVFAVPGDPSRSGRAPVPVPGVLRLVLELAVFGAGGLALAASGPPRLAWSFAGVALVHHIVSFARLRWLVRYRPE